LGPLLVKAGPADVLYSPRQPVGAQAQLVGRPRSPAAQTGPTARPGGSEAPTSVVGFWLAARPRAVPRPCSATSTCVVPPPRAATFSRGRTGAGTVRSLAQCPLHARPRQGSHGSAVHLGVRWTRNPLGIAVPEISGDVVVVASSTQALPDQALLCSLRGYVRQPGSGLH
jgi:hypothetical protein